MKGIKLPEEWVKKADVFLGDAERHLRDGNFWLSCFDSHQAAEFYLKSPIVAVTGFYPYTHDLSELLDALRDSGMEISENVRIVSKVLTPHYTLSRYPGRRAINYTEERAARCLRYSRLIVGWVRKVADP